MQYFGLKPEQAPLIIIMGTDDQKYLKDHVEPDAIAAWLKDYKVMSHVLSVVGSFHVALVSSWIFGIKRNQL